MNITFYMPTYNRLAVFKNSLATALNNSDIKPNRIQIIDDSSNIETKQFLLNFHANHPNVDLLLTGKNAGVGPTFERIYDMIMSDDESDIVCIMEADYYWRKDWLQDVVDVFDSAQHCIAIAGTDIPDEHESRIHRVYNDLPNEMARWFGTDCKNRQYLYKPFDISTRSGTITVKGYTSATGTLIIHLKRLKQMIKYLEDHSLISIGEYSRVIERACWKGEADRHRLQDGLLSGVIAKFGEMYLEHRGIDISKNFPELSICDYSISLHVDGGGISSPGIPEGTNQCHQPMKWEDWYLNENPRIKNKKK